MKRIFIIKFTKVFILCFMFLNVFGLLLDYHLRKSNLFKINLLFNVKTQENIILGASKSLTGINSKLLSKITKKSWYNLSMDDTKTETHVLFLKVLINLKKYPKSILLQYDRGNNYYDSLSFFDNDYQLLPFLNTNCIISDYFRPKSNYLIYKYVPIYKYIFYNTELLFPSLLLLFKPEYTHRFQLTTGDYSYPNGYHLNDTCKNWYHNNVILNNPIISEFDTLCNRKNAKLYIYTAPMYKVRTVTDVIRKDYFDFSNLFITNLKFHDALHIAGSARNEFTSHLAEIFIRTY